MAGKGGWALSMRERDERGEKREERRERREGPRCHVDFKAVLNRTTLILGMRVNYKGLFGPKKN